MIRRPVHRLFILAACCGAAPALPSPASPGPPVAAEVVPAALPSQIPGALAQTACFRRPDREEMSQFYGELRRKGWRSAIIPSVPTAYDLNGTTSEATESRLATLYGDVDG